MTMTSEQEQRISLEAEFVRIALEVEAEHGGQIFINRSPHCSMWSAQVFWPHWECSDCKGSYEQLNIYAIFNYGGPDDGSRDLCKVRTILTEAIHKLRDRESVAKLERIAALKRELAELED